MSTYYPESFVRELSATVERVQRELAEMEAQAALKRIGVERLQATLARVQAR